MSGCCSAGRLREDFTPEDLPLVYMANAGSLLPSRAVGRQAPAPPPTSLLGAIKGRWSLSKID